MNDLSKRLFSYSLNVLKYLKTLPETREFWVIKNQLYRSATAPGANYAESQSGCTRPDFHNRINNSLREMQESLYWLNMIQELRKGDPNLESLIRESIELVKILKTISYKTRKPTR